MIGYVDYLRGSQKSIIKKLNNLKLFSKIDGLKNKNIIRIETKKPIFIKNINKIKNIKKQLESIDSVKKVRLYPILKMPKSYQIIAKKQPKLAKEQKLSSKRFHLFFDVDSTLTRPGNSVPNSNVMNYFEKFKRYNCTLCFCSGRSRKQIDDLRKMYHTGDYGIAENGGIIIGVDKSDEKQGDRTEPNRLISYMLTNGIPVGIDPNQNNRITEYVLTHDSITEDALCDVIDLSKAKVEYHSSKNTYHISAKNKNKGSGIEYLTSGYELNLDPDIDEKIGIGDSDLDIPMFDFCDRGYLAGQPNAKLRKKLKKLENEVHILKAAPKAIEELYKKLFQYG